MWAERCYPAHTHSFTPGLTAVPLRSLGQAYECEDLGGIGQRNSVYATIFVIDCVLDCLSGTAVQHANAWSRTNSQQILGAYATIFFYFSLLMGPVLNLCVFSCVWSHQKRRRSCCVNAVLRFILIHPLLTATTSKRKRLKELTGGRQ